MRAIIQLPCEHRVKASARTPNELAVKLSAAVNKHAGKTVMKFETMDQWWSFLCDFADDFTLLVEDGETLEDEYDRVTEGMDLDQRGMLFAVYGMFCAVSTEAAEIDGEGVPTLPIYTEDEIEEMAFECGLLIVEDEWPNLQKHFEEGTEAHTMRRLQPSSAFVHPSHGLLH